MIEIINEINNNIDSSVITIPIGFDENYSIIDDNVFRNAINDFNGLIPDENSIYFIQYLDLKIKIGKIIANLQDKPTSDMVPNMTPYNYRNTINIAEEMFGSKDNLPELYLINNVNSDFEILSSGYIITPLRTEAL